MHILGPVLPFLELAGAMLLGAVVHDVVFALVRDGRHRERLRNRVLAALRGATRLGAALVAAAIAVPAIGFTRPEIALLDELASLAIIADVGWFLVALLHVAEAYTRAHYRLDREDNLLARKVRTRTNVLRRILSVVVLVITGAAMLMTFPAVRALGASILASAGIISLVAGLAAQPLLTNLLAGIQIAMTQPLRIDDIVVVNGEWGTVEEINVAFLVVRIWDRRRLILPLSYVLQNPFENWTYKTNDLLGYVLVYADYTVDVEAVRTEFKRLLDTTPWWDRKSWSLEVTALDNRTMTMRALFSVANADDRWNLMVMVQEKLIAFLRDTYPGALPKVRIMAPEAEQG